MATAGDISVHLGIAHSAFHEGLRASRNAMRRFSRDLHTDVGESARKQERELGRVRALIERVTARFSDTGREGGRALNILVEQEARLTKAIGDRKRMADTARKALTGDAPAAAAARPVVDAAKRQEQELKRVRDLIERVSARYAETGREGGRALEMLVRREQGLTQAISARKTMVDNVRAAITSEGKVAETTARQKIDSARKQERELARVRDLIGRVTARYAETGRDGGRALDALIRHESRLVQSINARKAMTDRARQSLQQEQQEIAQRIAQSNLLQFALDEEAEKTQRVNMARAQGMAGPGRAGAGGLGGAGGARMLGTGLAYGLSDAFSAGMYGGFRGAALGAANNLPMVGEGIAAVSAKAAKGTSVFAGLAGVLARFAGPAGLVASVALPFAAALAPALLSAESAADKFKRQAEEVEAALERIKKAREEEERVQSLRKNDDDLDSQKDRVKTLRGELSDLQNLRAELALQVSHASRVAGNDGLWGFVNGADGQLEEARAKMLAVEEQMREKSRELERQSAIEAEGTAAKDRREAWNKKYADIRKEAEARIYWQGVAIKKDAAERASQRERERVLRESSMQWSAERSLLGRWGQLQRQRVELMRTPTFNLATTTDRHNSVERIAQMIADAGARATGERRDAEIKKLDEQLRVLERIYDAVRSEDQGSNLAPLGLH